MIFKQTYCSGKKIVLLRSELHAFFWQHDVAVKLLDLRLESRQINSSHVGPDIWTQHTLKRTYQMFCFQLEIKISTRATSSRVFGFTFLPEASP